MKFNYEFTKELYDSFIYGLIISIAVLFFLLVFANISPKACFLFQGIIWLIVFNVMYIFINKYKSNEYMKLTFINALLLVFIYIMVFA